MHSSDGPRRNTRILALAGLLAGGGLSMSCASRSASPAAAALDAASLSPSPQSAIAAVRAPTPRAAGPAVLRIGFVPSDGLEDARAAATELARLLSKRIDRAVDAYVSEDYGSLILAMKEKKVDFAFFTAAMFVEAERVAGAKVLMKKAWTTPFYRSVILAKSDSGVRKLKDLKGKRVAFVDRQSTSGYLYPIFALRKAFPNVESELASIAFSGSHPASVELLKSGQADAIAVYAQDDATAGAAKNATRNAAPRANAWTERSGRPASDVRALWTSPPIPGDPFCVRQDFYQTWPRVVHDAMFAMVEMQDDPIEGARFKKLVGAQSLVFATSRQYDSIREVVGAAVSGQPAVAPTESH